MTPRRLESPENEKSNIRHIQVHVHVYGRFEMVDLKWIQFLYG